MTQILLYTGTNIRQSHEEQLQPVTLDAVWQQIIGETSPLYKETQLLRRVARLDAAAAQRLKTRLPFICCSQFSDGIRKADHFEQSTGFILDIDNVPKDPAYRLELLQQFKQDPEVALVYQSPGGNGYKLLFILQHPITELRSYTSFYKLFLHSFAHKYQLEPYLDTATCDATRVSFLCHDADAWLNPVPVAVDHYQSMSTIETESIHAHQTEFQTSRDATGNCSNQLSKEQYRQLLNTLHPERPAKAPKQIFVPPLLHELMVHVQAQAAAVGIAIAEVLDIHYGKKVVFANLADRAEVNLFYGKKGFSVVKTPKRGSNEELAEIGARIIRLALTQPITQTRGVSNEE
jgi:hypothetical protein